MRLDRFLNLKHLIEFYQTGYDTHILFVSVHVKINDCTFFIN